MPVREGRSRRGVAERVRRDGSFPFVWRHPGVRRALRLYAPVVAGHHWLGSLTGLSWHSAGVEGSFAGEAEFLEDENAIGTGSGDGLVVHEGLAGGRIVQASNQMK